MDLPSSEDSRSRPGPAPGRWRFAGFELDETSGRLLHGGQAQLLDHGSYGVLHELLRQAGKIVGKDALLAAGWPGRVVSENSLTKAISRLRQLLDDPDGALLCTAHGYGYRLATRAEWSLAPAQPVEEAPTTPEAEQVPLPTRPGSPRLLVFALLVCVLALALLAWSAWRPVARPPSALVAASGRSPAAAPSGESASVAVLPFVDMSERHDQQYFSDGLADEMLDQLAKLSQLRVASRTSSFAFRGSDLGAQEIGRRLGVATVLEGSVRRDADRVRITVQLIKVADGFHLWSETYDKRMTDLFSVQDDIARSVVAAMRVELLPGQALAVTRHSTKNPAAFNEYMRGERFRYLNTDDNDRRAIAAYERAIAIDPQFSAAYASLANLLGGDARYADSPEQVRAGKQRSLQLMDKAIALEGDRPDFYLQRADFLYSTSHDWAGAQRDLDTAARLYRRRSPQVLNLQSRLLAVLGRFDDAIAADRASLAAAPGSTTAMQQLGYHLVMSGRYDEAHRLFADAARRLPTDDHIPYYEGLAWLLERRYPESVAAFERSGSVFRLAGVAAAEFDAGHEAASLAALDTLRTRYAPIGAYQVAQAHAWRGERDQAFAWLQRAAAQNDAGLMYLKVDPLMRRLREDPRYRAWLVRLKLDDDAALRRL